MVLLREFRYQPDKSKRHENDFPFNLPILNNTLSVRLSNVSIFIGENGTGKSTLLEGLATKLNLQTLGESPIRSDPSLEPARKLSENIKLVWEKRTHQGFFMRAEDFFAYLKKIEIERNNNQNELKSIDETYQDRSRMAKILAQAPFSSGLDQIKKNFGENADGESHGESFMSIFRRRFVPNGVYILDEPEAALSPISQLGLISLIKHAVNEGSQFILATHSPILMAIPNADLFSCDNGSINLISYEESEHVALYRAFLSNPEQFLRRL
ncbi:MAG: AAA family ATPase [Promethearchaeota archaeon]|jgi:predicted ATPase